MNRRRFGPLPVSSAALALAVSGARLCADPSLDFGDEPPRPAIRIWKAGEAVELESRLDVGFAPERVWDVVLDYDRIADYMPNVDSSRIVWRDDSRVRVRQVGGTRFIFRRTFRLVLEFWRESPDRVAFRHVTGDLAGLSGTWSVVPQGADRSQIVYRATLPYGLGAPWVLGRGALYRTIRRMMPAIRDELERRYEPASGRRAG
jgi:carbon monoxide dehydrogenase subunit G